MSELRPASKILVTGATGFTGGALARRLKAMGHDVRTLARAGSRVRPVVEDGIEVVEGDLVNADDVARAVEGCGYVFHVAALFRPAGHADAYFYDVNVAGTQHVLDACRASGVERMVHCSTVGVHGHVSRIPSDETAPYNPGDVYQVTKLEGEKLVQQAAASQPVSIVRPAGIYGPGDLRFLKLFKSVYKKRFRMFGSGEITYHFTYIDDLVDGFILCSHHPKALGDIFIIGGDEYISLNEVVALVATSVGVDPPRGRLPLAPLMWAAKACETMLTPFGIDPPLHTRRVEFFVKARAFSNAKAKRVLGYQPKVSLADGMQRTADWYFAEGHLG